MSSVAAAGAIIAGAILAVSIAVAAAAAVQYLY